MKKMARFLVTVGLLAMMWCIPCMAAELPDDTTIYNGPPIIFKSSVELSSDSKLVLNFNDRPFYLSAGSKSNVELPLNTVSGGISMNAIEFSSVSDDTKKEELRKLLGVQYRIDGSNWSTQMVNGTGITVEPGKTYEFLVKGMENTSGETFSNSLQFSCEFLVADEGVGVPGESMPMPMPEEQKNVQRKCSHHYEWNVIQNATATQEGYEQLMCSCGSVLESRKISAFGCYLDEAKEAILNAAPGSKVKLDTNMWVSFNKEVMEAIDKRWDISIDTAFRYKGVDYTLTIPERTPDTKITEEGVDWYGYLYLGLQYPVVKKEDNWKAELKLQHQF